MKVRELYTQLNEKIPPSLSCSWDNDGLMCCPDLDREVRRVLVALDITGRVIDAAIEGKYDLVISHHPLIFVPLKAVTPADFTANKVVRLLCAGISAMSFHTRLDAVEGGVNDTLAEALGLCDVRPFGPEGEQIGRIGVLPAPVSLDEFAATVRRVTEAKAVRVADGGRPVHHVAVLGGGGADEVGAAMAAGADTYLTGEFKHHNLTDAPDLGINLIEGGHFHTENPVCRRIEEMLRELDPTVTVDLMISNAVRILG